MLPNLLMAGSVGALGYAGAALGLTYLAPQPLPFQPPERAASAAMPEEAAPVLNTVWPAVFGTVVIPEPAPQVLPEPRPEPVAELPPEENTSYFLTGLVAGGTDSWAMVAENDRSVVVRVGDALVGGEAVTAIDAAGVWISWNGEAQLIPVRKSDLTHLVRIVQVRSAETAEPGVPFAETSQVSLQVERLDRRFIEEAFFEAGRLAGAKLADGSSGLDVVWIKRGQLYDQIGLETGDTILRINGKSVETTELPADTPNEVFQSGALDLEILRNGARQLIKVSLDQI